MTQENTIESTVESTVESNGTLPAGQTLEEQMNEQVGAGVLVEEDTSEPVPSDAEIIEQLRVELAAEKVRADDMLDKWQRTLAEAQNSRRRQEKQLAEELERASARIIRRLLPVVDDFALALQNMPTDLDSSAVSWVEGFRQIQKKLGSIMEDEGVTPIVANGEFDPNQHEAVTSEAHDSIPSGHIIDTLRTGYEHKGRVLRPALVRVVE